MFVNPNDLSGIVIQGLINQAFRNIGKAVALLLAGKEINSAARLLLEHFSKQCTEGEFEPQVSSNPALDTLMEQYRSFSDEPVMEEELDKVKVEDK